MDLDEAKWKIAAAQPPGPAGVVAGIVSELLGAAAEFADELRAEKLARQALERKVAILMERLKWAADPK